MTQTNYIALSIAAGFALVAMAIYATNSGSSPVIQNPDGSVMGVTRDANQWVYGNPRAATSIVEFSDFECPFCSRVHPTIKQIVDESDGTINWHYRHLPLPSHRNAELAAMTSECVGRFGGNEAFWQFTDTVFENQRQVNAAYLESTALATGISITDLSSCLNDDTVREQVAIDTATARALGGSGTPYSVIVFPDGSIAPVNGALPYDNWQRLIESNQS